MPKIRRLYLQYAKSRVVPKSGGCVCNSRTRAENQAACVDNTRTHKVTNSCQNSGGCVCNTRSHELVLKIRRLVFSTHELIKSRTCAKNQAVVFSTHELTKSRTRAENRAACVDNTRAHEVTNSCWKSDGLCWQRTNSRSHELVPKIGRLCFQHMRSRTRAENRATCVDNTRTHEVKLL